MFLLLSDRTECVYVCVFVLFPCAGLAARVACNITRAEDDVTDWIKPTAFISSVTYSDVSPFPVLISSCVLIGWSLVSWI